MRFLGSAQNQVHADILEFALGCGDSLDQSVVPLVVDLAEGINIEVVQLCVAQLGTTDGCCHGVLFADTAVGHGLGRPCGLL